MLNKIDIYSYFSKDVEFSELTLLNLCLLPSEQYIERWMPLLTFHSDSYQCYGYDEEGGLPVDSDLLKTGNPVCVPEVEPEDYLEASRLFELCETVCHKFFKPNSSLNRRTKWLIPKLRVDMTKRPIEPIKQELTYEI